MAFVKTAPLSDLKDGELLDVVVGGVDVCLARVEGEVYAFRNNCSHQDFPLCEGELDIDDCTITCEWHGAEFDIRTGEALTLPATRPIPVFACKVEDGQILVDVDQPPA